MLGRGGERLAGAVHHGKRPPYRIARDLEMRTAITPDLLHDKHAGQERYT